MDRLVEFGMGMAMSQQIAASMNNMMANMRQPPLAPSPFQPLPVQSAINTAPHAAPVYQQFAGAGGTQIAPQQVSQNPAAFAHAGNNAPPPVSEKAAGAAESAYQAESPSENLLLPEVYYIAKGDSAEGPYSRTETARLMLKKEVDITTLIWKVGSAEWKTAVNFPELIALVALNPPALQEVHQ